MIGDYDKIREEFDGIILRSQAYPFEINTSALFEKWAKNKAAFIRIFGDKTIVRSSQPIKVKLNDEARRRKFDTFCSYIEDEYDIYSSNYDLYKFIHDNQDGFFDNKVIKSCPTKNIPAGAKLLKSFKKFGMDHDTTRSIQDIASRYIQEDKVEGYLYLSVDPRDYLTISENAENWSSCHALDNDYRAGNLNYMTDRVTIVAYLADETKKYYPCLPKGMEWNSKKWRMLVHIDLGRVIYYNKQYPFSHDDLLDKVYDMIFEYFPMCHPKWPRIAGFKSVNLPGGATCVLDETVLNLMDDRVYNSRDVIDYSDYYGYEDLIKSPVFVPYVSVNSTLWGSWAGDSDKWFHDNMDIKIGESAPCVCCGKESINRTNSFLCDMCIAEEDADEDFFVFCNSCGRRLYDPEETVVVGNDVLCSRCAVNFDELEEEDNNA